MWKNCNWERKEGEREREKNGICINIYKKDERKEEEFGLFSFFLFFFFKEET